MLAQNEYKESSEREKKSIDEKIESFKHKYSQVKEDLLQKLGNQEEKITQSDVGWRVLLDDFDDIVDFPHKYLEKVK